MLSARLRSVWSLGLRSRAFVRHLYQKVAALTVGAVFVSKPGRSLRERLAGSRAQVPPPDLAVAIVAHLYYLDLLPEILACRRVLPGTVPLFLTVPAEKVEQANQLLSNVPACEVHPCSNRGRDIAPFLDLLATGALDRFDAVLKLHTKRSPHLLDGNIRRKLLFAMLCGERNATLRALKAFEEPTTGMVGWADCYRTARPYWMGNEARVREIAARMGAPQGAMRLGFFEGSMFWFRPSAFAALRGMAITTEDFEPEKGQVDGTLHHAMERCFTIAAWARGFVVQDLRGRLLS